MKQKIGIIGGGFAGTMTAVQIILQTQLVEKEYKNDLEIFIFNQKESFNKGIAYNSYSDKHLLNVSSIKMSAFPDQPTHFLDWILKKEGFKKQDYNWLANAYLPRKLYGEYLSQIWEDTIQKASQKNISVFFIDSIVDYIEINNTNSENKIAISTQNKSKIVVDKCIIATGNQIPRNPTIKNNDFYKSKNYFQNPWQQNAINNLDAEKSVLIIGNGLTMVDIVLSLLEKKSLNDFNGKIYSISPNGFNILPHRNNGIKYTHFVEELEKLTLNFSVKLSLLEVVKLVNKHIKLVRSLGLSAESVIDSIRPYTQMIWRNLSDKEKKIFMSRLRHLWGVARHRIPLHIHDKIQKLRIEGKLNVYSGKLIDINEIVKDKEERIEVKYFDKKEKITKKITVGRIINCTGAETNLMNLEDDNFLKKCLSNGILKQDKLKLGICTDIDTFQILDKNDKSYPNLFTIGSNLKGQLWESTAINELRNQAHLLAKELISKI